ncbi:MAG: helix-turn-helix domain-containing protein, partial [Planctomycetota bacterium]|nr:helix-turn-helix domain-containing protein [Planctomycetota bacterium]
MASQQKTFDFNRAQRQKFIRLLPLPKRRHLKQVLERIEWYLGDNPTCWPFVRTLAADCNTSISTVTRALSDLHAMGYITIEPTFVPGVGQSYNHYAILWTKVVNDSHSPSAEQPATTPTRRLKQRRPLVALATLGEGTSPPSQTAPPLRQTAPP